MCFQTSQNFKSLFPRYSTWAKELGIYESEDSLSLYLKKFTTYVKTNAYDNFYKIVQKIKGIIFTLSLDQNKPLKPLLQISKENRL